MCRICYLPAGDCHIPAPGVCHAGTGIIIGTRTVRVLYEIGATSDTRQPFGDCRSWWLPIKLPCTHCPTPQAHHHVELKQSTSINIADVGGSSSSGSAAEDDLGSGQHGDCSRILESIRSRVILAAHVCVPLRKLYHI